MNGQVSSLERLEGQETHPESVQSSHQSESSLNRVAQANCCVLQSALKDKVG
jgi:hypothetical protein